MRGVIELGTIKVVNGGYYEVMTCEKLDIEDEKYQRIVADRCKAREKGSIEILKIIVVRDKHGNITKIWTIEAYYGPFGILLFIDNP